VIIASVESIMNGVDGGIIATTFKHHSFGTPTDTRPTTEGLAISIYNVGSAVGTLVIGPIIDRIGRCRALTLLSTISLIGVCLQAGSTSLAQLMVGPFIAGLGIGMAPITISTYVSEVALAKERGVMIGIQGCFRPCGYTIASWICFASSYDSSSEGTWRIPLTIIVLTGLPVFASVATLAHRKRSP
jgi:MFS family permease